MKRTNSSLNNWFEIEQPDQEDYFLIPDYDITATPNDFNIKTIYDFIESGVVHIPDFQRNFVWDIKRSSRLIESIVIGIPIPQIFLYEEYRNKFLVIDGQQRLMSIFYFIKKRFPKKEKRGEIRKIMETENMMTAELLENDDYFTKFNLNLPTSLPNIRNKLHGLNYATLGENKTPFDLRTIRNVIIKQNLPSDDDSSIYEIFNRLNTGGVNLKPQEIRTSLYHSEFYTMLYRINNNETWRKLLGLTEPDLNKKDIEFLLRGFAMLIEGKDYKPSMTKFLNNFSKQCKNLQPEGIKYLEMLFYSFLEACADIQKNPFHGKSTNKFNILIYESVFYAACRDSYERKDLNVRTITLSKLQKLKDDTDFIAATKLETARATNVSSRLTRAYKIINAA